MHFGSGIAREKDTIAVRNRDWDVRRMACALFVATASAGRLAKETHGLIPTVLAPVDYARTSAIIANLVDASVGQMQDSYGSVALPKFTP
jgi:hypothetical protein